MTRLRATENGLTSTELAVVMPVIIALVLVPFQVALWWHAGQVAEASAREALDAAQVVTATEEDGIEAAEWFLDSAGNITDPEVSVTRTTDTGQDRGRLQYADLGLLARNLFVNGIATTVIRRNIVFVIEDTIAVQVEYGRIDLATRVGIDLHQPT